MSSLGQCSTVVLRFVFDVSSSHVTRATIPLEKNNRATGGEMLAFHATTMDNTLTTPIIVFTRTGSMAVFLSKNRPSSTIFAFTNSERVKQRLELYHGVMPIFMEFSDDTEETFSRALKLLLNKDLMKENQYVTLVQSRAQPIWRRESTHHIQVLKVQAPSNFSKLRRTFWMVLTKSDASAFRWI